MNAGGLGSNLVFFSLSFHVQLHKGVVIVSWAAGARRPSPNTSPPFETDPLVSTHMLLDPPTTHPPSGRVVKAPVRTQEAWVRIPAGVWIFSAL